MTDVSRALTDEDINAYVDGEMPVEDLAETARQLTRDPELLVRAEEYRLHRMALRKLYDRKLPSETPEHLRRLLYGDGEKSASSSATGSSANGPTLVQTDDQEAPKSQSEKPASARSEARPSGGHATDWRWARYAIAATTALLFIGASAAGGWIGHSRYIQGVFDQTQTQTFMNQAYSAHSLYSFGGEAETVSEDRLKSVLSTLAENLGLSDDAERPRFAPPRSRDTFRLVSSEVIPVAGRVGAVFHYVDDQGQKVSLYVQPNWNQRQQFENVIQTEDIALQYRAEGILAYALAAPAGLEGLPGLESWLGGGD